MSRLISRKYSFRKLNIILLSVVIVFTLFISIGYSAINSNLLISGDLAAEYNEFSLYEQVRRDAYSNKFVKNMKETLQLLKEIKEFTIITEKQLTIM